MAEIRLSELRAGSAATVVRLDENHDSATTQLIGLGVLPGSELRLIRRFPAFIVEVGETEFAVDRELARRILVRTSA